MMVQCPPIQCLLIWCAVCFTYYIDTTTTTTITVEIHHSLNELNSDPEVGRKSSSYGRSFEEKTLPIMTTISRNLIIVQLFIEQVIPPPLCSCS